MSKEVDQVIEAVKAVSGALAPLDSEDREWVLRTVNSYFEMVTRHVQGRQEARAEEQASAPQAERPQITLTHEKSGKWVQLMSTEEAGNYLARTPATISGYVRSGKLKPAKRAKGKRGKMFFRARDLDKLLGKS